MLATLLLTACGPGDGETLDRAMTPQPADTAAPAGWATIVMTVPSMSCPLCVRSIRARLEEAGLAEIRIDLDTKRVEARLDTGRISSAEVVALVEGQGFPVEETTVDASQDVKGGGQ